MSDTPQIGRRNGTSPMPSRPGWFSETAEVTLQSIDVRVLDGGDEPLTRDQELIQSNTFALLECANALHRIADIMEEGS